MKVICSFKARSWLSENETSHEKSDQKQADDVLENGDEVGTSEEAKKKRKRNRNKNKKKAEGSEAKSSEVAKQTDPPTLPVSQLFPDGNFPVGQIMDHHVAMDDRKAADRFSSEESRAIDRAQLDMYNEIRQAAEAHRQTRQHIQRWVKPGMKMIDICNELESTARKLINEEGLKVTSLKYTYNFFAYILYVLIFITILNWYDLTCLYFRPD